MFILFSLFHLLEAAVRAASRGRGRS